MKSVRPVSILFQFKRKKVFPESLPVIPNSSKIAELDLTSRRANILQTDIWLVVKVPVLSEQITEVHPRVSTEGKLLTYIRSQKWFFKLFNLERTFNQKLAKWKHDIKKKKKWNSQICWDHLWTIAMEFFLAIRRVPRARHVVITAGSPSGMAATARATAILK